MPIGTSSSLSNFEPLEVMNFAIPTASRRPRQMQNMHRTATRPGLLDKSWLPSLCKAVLELMFPEVKSEFGDEVDKKFEDVESREVVPVRV